MKKALSVFTVLFLLLLTLAGCGSSKSTDGLYAKTESLYDNYGFDASDESYEESSAESNSKGTADYQQIADASSRKLIRDASISVETENYDDFSSVLDTQISSLGGYVENLSENNNVYSSYRSKTLTVRIPSEKLDEFLNAVSEGASITSKSVEVRDVTGNYIDTQSRIKALETEMDALLEILAKADSVSDLITVQDRITEVNAELEACKSKLKTYDDLIAYSTVNLNVREVKRVTSTEQESAGAEIVRRLKDNLYNIAQGARSFLISFISSIPYLLIVAIIVIVVILIIKKIRKSRKKRKNKKEVAAVDNTAEIKEDSNKSEINE